jgi:hypothetical protein
MKKSLAFLALAALAIGTAQAETPALVASADKRAPEQTQPQAPTEAEAQNPIQSLCREIFVDTDEGYGVTNRESRTICDEVR